MLNAIWELKLNYFAVSPIRIKVFCCLLVLFFNRAHLAISQASQFSSPREYTLSYCFPVLVSGLFLLLEPFCTLSFTASTMNSATSFTTILETWLFILFSLWVVHQIVAWEYITIGPFFALLLAAHLPFTKCSGFWSTLISFIVVVVSWSFVPIWRVDALEVLLLIYAPEFVVHVYGIAVNMVNLFLLFLSNTLVRISLK